MYTLHGVKHVHYSKDDLSFLVERINWSDNSV